RRTAKIKALDAILPQLTRQALRAARFIQQRQINPPPARPHRRNNDLHRTAQPRMPKAGAQARMAQKQRLNRSFQRLALERPPSGPPKTQPQLPPNGPRVRTKKKPGEPRPLPPPAPRRPLPKSAGPGPPPVHPRPGSAPPRTAPRGCPRPPRAKPHGQQAPPV